MWVSPPVLVVHGFFLLVGWAKLSLPRQLGSWHKGPLSRLPAGSRCPYFSAAEPPDSGSSGPCLQSDAAPAPGRSKARIEPAEIWGYEWNFCFKLGKFKDHTRILQLSFWLWINCMWKKYYARHFDIKIKILFYSLYITVHLGFMLCNIVIRKLLLWTVPVTHGVCRWCFAAVPAAPDAAAWLSPAGAVDLYSYWHSPST